MVILRMTAIMININNNNRDDNSIWELELYRRAEIQ